MRFVTPALSIQYIKNAEKWIRTENQKELENSKYYIEVIDDDLGYTICYGLNIDITSGFRIETTYETRVVGVVSWSQESVALYTMSIIRNRKYREEDKEKVEDFGKWYLEHEEKIVKDVCNLFRKKVLEKVDEEMKIRYNTERMYIEAILHGPKFKAFITKIVYFIVYRKNWKNFVIREEDEIIEKYINN